MTSSFPHCLSELPGTCKRSCTNANGLCNMRTCFYTSGIVEIRPRPQFRFDCLTSAAYKRWCAATGYSPTSPNTQPSFHGTHPAANLGSLAASTTRDYIKAPRQTWAQQNSWQQHGHGNIAHSMSVRSTHFDFCRQLGDQTSFNVHALDTFRFLQTVGWPKMCNDLRSEGN